MFLEAQFGADNLTPISIPRLPPMIKSASPEEESEDLTALHELQEKEIERLHKIGIPVPGIEIRVDKVIAKVWLEDLEVECGNRTIGDRVRVVVERAVEVIAPLWG